MIVEAVEDRRQLSVDHELDCRRNLDCIQTLRLVHPRFAYLKASMRNLFYMIALPADSDGLERLSNTNLDAVLPFVREVKFLYPAFIAGLSFEQFKEIVWRGQEQPEHGEGMRYHEMLLAQSQLNRTSGSAQGAKAAFEIYHTRAKADRDAMVSEQMEEALASTVKRMPNAHRFVIGNERDVRPGTDIAIQPFDLITSNNRYKYLRAVEGDKLLLLTTNIIERSQPALKELQIECDNSGRSVYTPTDSWRHIDLSRLVNFVYDGQVRPDYTLLPGRGHGRDDHFLTLITLIANQAASTLCQLKVHGEPGSLWNAPEKACERLQRLDLCSIRVGKNFNSWLKRCSSLNYLSMGMLRGIGMDTFWTIRHMQPLLLEMDQVICNAGMEASTSYYTSDWVEHVHDPDGEYYIDWEPALQAFLCGSADASPHLLKMWQSEG